MITIGSRAKITAAFLALLLLAAALVPLTAKAAGTTITEYAGLTAGSEPAGITSGPDGALWFTESNGNRIGRIDPTTHTVTEYGGLTASSGPRGITSGPDGALWFTEFSGGRIGRIDPTTHSVTEYGLADSGRAPAGITSGPDGALWFTEYFKSSNQVGRIDPTTHAVTEYGLAAQGVTEPWGITSGHDGAIWVTETGGQIARIDPTTHAVTEYGGLTAGSRPSGITSGPDGAIWFTEAGGNQIGRIDPTTHAVTEYGGLTAGSGPTEITSGPDGALWFTESNGNQVGRIDPTTHAVTEYGGLTAGSEPWGITSGPDGALWFTESNGNQIGRVLFNPPVPPPSQWKSTFYFAEGYTGANFQEYATLENPDAAAADAWITCMFTDGTSQSQYYRLAPVSRLTVDINQLVGAGKEVSMSVVSTSTGIVAERPMYFNYNGIWTGGSDAVGATAPNTNWYFAEGNTFPNFDQYITVLNPGDATANLTFQYMVEGLGEKDATGSVGAHSRATFNTRGQIGADLNASLYLSSSQAVVAERPMYFNYQGLASNNWTGGHDVVGANSPAKAWYLAEGTTRGGFEEWLCLQNPGSSPITVDATYQLGSGQGNPIQKSYTVPAKQRLTVSVNKEIGTNKDDSVQLSSTDMFIAERPMYFNYHDGWTGGHDVLGANNSAKTWFFAEGTTRDNFNEWLCLQNPGSSDAHTTITYYTASGQAIPKNWTVPANSRLTVDVNQDAGANQDISAKVSSDNPIIVERPMYFSCNGWTGGHDVVGYVPQ